VKLNSTTTDRVLCVGVCVWKFE